MKGVLWLLALFAIAVAVTLAAKYNSGYVLVVAQPYRIELSLNLLAVLLAVAFFVAYFVVRLAVITLRLPTEVSEIRLRRRREKARRMMMDGLKAFFEGRYAKAEKASASALKLEESSADIAINAIVAARSAHELRRYSQRDEFIAIAEHNAPEEIALRSVTQAELMLDERRPGEALKILHSMGATGIRPHTAVLRLELKAQHQSGNWDAVLELLKQLEQRNAFDKAVIRQLRCNAHVENLKSKISNPQELKDYWQRISSEDKKDSKLAAAAAHACTVIGEGMTAHQIIEQGLDEQWDSELAELYAECLGNNAIRQIERAETWLEFHPNDPHLLRALGKLCIHCELWGKAQNYLEASLSLEPSHPSHLLLAQLNEKIGRPELAKDHYRKGLDLALKRLEGR